MILTLSRSIDENLPPGYISSYRDRSPHADERPGSLVGSILDHDALDAITLA
jgi:hypothetical protein